MCDITKDLTLLILWKIILFFYELSTRPQITVQSQAYHGPASSAQTNHGTTRRANVDRLTYILLHYNNYATFQFYYKPILNTHTIRNFVLSFSSLGYELDHEHLYKIK